MKRITIAIDGPAASGKSTVGAAVAQRLGFLYFDTGVMYRAVTRAALDRGIIIEDEMAVTDLALRLRIDISPPTIQDGRQSTICADGEDIPWEVRSTEVNAYVSPVATYSGVRQTLVAQQRRIGQGGGVVMVGRDITTVVLPGAEVKVFLDASLEERAHRRLLDKQRRGEQATLAEIMDDLGQRDRIDSSRQDSPLQIALEATVIDSTDMPIDDVVDQIVILARTATSLRLS